MEEGNTRKRHYDLSSDYSGSQDKRQKLSSDDIGISASEENLNGTLNSPGTQEYKLLQGLPAERSSADGEALSEQENPERKKTPGAKLRENEEETWVLCSSQVTVVLSEAEDDAELDTNQNNVTVNLENELLSPLTEQEESTVVKLHKDEEKEISSSQETIPLSSVEPDTELEADANQNCATENLQTTQPSPSPRQLWKDTSLIKDADTVANIFPDADSAVVFDTLAKHRADPERLNIATAAVLDSNFGVTDSSETDRKQAAPSSEPASEAQYTTVGENSGQSSSSGGSTLYDDVKKVITKVKGVNPGLEVNATEAYLLLEQHAEQAERVNFVSNIFLKNTASCAVQNEASSDDHIFNQALKLTAEFPQVDPSEVYELLEKADGQENALQGVREKLKAMSNNCTPRNNNDTSTPKPSIPRDDSIPNDPLFRDNPVYHDMRIISKMFPDKDQNELYAMVEAHYYKKDRVQVVIEELLRVERGSQDSSIVSYSVESFQSASGLETAAPASLRSPIKSAPTDDLLQNDVRHLRDIFPDCDPNYIYERLEACQNVADRVNILATEMFERKEYPRLKDIVEKQTKAARKQRLQKMTFTIEEFLAKFPEPTATFATEEKEMKENYKAHVTAKLKHDFPDFKQSFVESVVKKHNSHLLPIIKELEATRDEILARGGRSKKMRKAPKEEQLVYPAEPDEYFFYELWFSMNEQRVKDHFEQKEAEHKIRVEEARACNELYECGCCFEDECLFEEMNACADGHLFCRLCIARSAEAAFGEGKTTFPCLTGECEHQIPLSVLKEILPSSMFSKILRKLQEEEVRQAGIPDLVDCPFCSFATIMADPDDRVFRCLNPECLKDSCRLCREPNHVPLKCEEVEKQSETDMRTFIEKRVTEAMLRKCHRCGKRFVKDMGCNKMTCICGASSCYVCREPDIDYSHFNDNTCNEGDMNKLHQKEMERAAEDAKREYLKDHPEAAEIDLKYDPMQHIHNGDGNIFGGGDGYDDSGSSDDDISVGSESISRSSDSFDSDEEEGGRTWYL